MYGERNGNQTVEQEGGRMSEWKPYRRKGITEMRPYIPGENLWGISVSDTDTPKKGGMIARNPDNHDDMWYVAPEWFVEKYEEAKQ